MSKTAAKPETPATFLRVGDRTPGAKQVVLVPGHEVPLIALDLPKGLRGQAREQVARRQLADRLGTKNTVEMRPFAPGKTGEGWTRVLITDQSKTAAWRGLTCRAVLPDYLSLPTAEGLWTVAGDTLDGADVIMVRLGPQDGFSATPEMARIMLEQALNGGKKPKAILCQTKVMDGLEALAQSHNVGLVEAPDALQAQGVDAPKILGHGELTCDLRRDPLAARAQLARRVLPWRWPLLAGAVAAALWAATQMLAIERIETQTATITAQTQALVQTHFVTSGPVLDMRVQVSRMLADLRAAQIGDDTGSDPLELAGRAIDVLAREQATPETISFRAGEGLLLVLRLPDFAAGERVTASLNAEGLSAELRESRVSDAQSGVRTEINVRIGGAEQ